MFLIFFYVEPLKREILINTDKLFVERVKLFKNIPSSLVSSIAASCRKEQFLPNDLVNFILLIHFCRSIYFPFTSIIKFLSTLNHIHLIQCKLLLCFFAFIKIIKAGTVGECMFFIASGSVCVITTNGQELCHLEDYDFFGEVEFVLKNRKVSMSDLSIIIYGLLVNLIEK